MDRRTEAILIKEFCTLKTQIRKMETLIAASLESNEKPDINVTDWKGYLTAPAERKK